MVFPRVMIGGKVVHSVIPNFAAHLIAFEWSEQNPGRMLRVGWILTDEEKQAGKTGVPWPEDV